MTPEEAIKLLKSSTIMNVEINKSQLPLASAVKLAIEALEKQIPKKPLPDNEYHLKGICPTCGVHFLDKGTKYCGNCGQRLKWEDDENDS